MYVCKEKCVEKNNGLAIGVVDRVKMIKTVPLSKTHMVLP